jgi:hypothetical protein
MPFKKGQSGNPKGRKKGQSNRTTAIVREGICHAYEGIGGDKAFQVWAKANPGEFYTKVLTKLLPHEVTGKDGADLLPAVTRVIHTFTEDRAEPR